MGRRHTLTILRPREYLQHARLRRRLEDVVRRELLRLRILRGANALRRPRQIVRGPPVLNRWTEQNPVRPGLAERHAHASRVDHTHPAHRPVELHVRVAADDRRHIDPVEGGSRLLLRSVARDAFGVAPRRRMTEQHVPEPRDLELTTDWPARDRPE